MKKILRITTSSGSLRSLLKGQLGFINQHYEVIGVANSGKGIREVRDYEGIRTIAVDMTRTISPIKDLISLFKLYRLIKAEKPFIVHTHTPKAGTLGMLAARMAGVKLRLHTIAGMPLMETKGIKRWLLNAVERFTYSNATMILPNSYGLYKFILDESFTSKEKLKVIGNGSSNGIDTDHFDPQLITEETKNTLRQSLGYHKDDIVFIYVGRLVKDKGTNELVAAFTELFEHHKNCKLLLVGLYESHIDPLNDETNHNIESHQGIKFVGRQSDVRPYFAISDILAFPSYREGFPNVVLEAAAMGLPSIVTDINGCNEIIEGNYNGIIIPPKHKDELLNAMTYLVENPEQRIDMASRSRKKIVNNYQRKYIWNELLKLYLSLDKSNS